MNYIELINNYWQLREQGIVSGSEGDLYMYLLHISNKLGWKNPFNQSNRLICAYLGISEHSLIRYRNILKQVGLIEFESGKAIRQNSSYTLLDTCKIYSSVDSNPVSRYVSSVDSNPVSRSDLKCADYNKHINKTKQNKTLSLSPEATEKEKKKERVDFFEFLFFEKRILKPADEAERFINHYEKTDWIDANGNKITNKLAALKNWKVTEGLQVIPQNFADKWRELYIAVKNETAKSSLMITDLNGFQIIDNRLKLIVTQNLHSFIEDPETITAIKPAYLKLFSGLTLEYTITK